MKIKKCYHQYPEIERKDNNGGNMNRTATRIGILTVLSIFAIATVIAQTGNIPNGTQNKAEIQSKIPAPQVLNKTAILNLIKNAAIDNTTDTSDVADTSSQQTKSSCTSAYPKACVYLSITKQPEWYTYCDGECDPDGYNSLYMSMMTNVVDHHMKAKKGIYVSYHLYVQDSNDMWHDIANETKKTDSKGNAIFVFDDTQTIWPYRGHGQSAVVVTAIDTVSGQYTFSGVDYFSAPPIS